MTIRHLTYQDLLEAYAPREVTIFYPCVADEAEFLTQEYDGSEDEDAEGEEE